MPAADKALEYIEECIRDHPDELECFCVKRRILKHAGDLEGAIEAANTASVLDASDRYSVNRIGWTGCSKIVTSFIPEDSVH